MLFSVHHPPVVPPLHCNSVKMMLHFGCTIASFRVMIYFCHQKGKFDNKKVH